MGEHLINGEFQSDKYPTTPRGKDLSPRPQRPVRELQARVSIPADREGGGGMKKQKMFALTYLDWGGAVHKVRPYAGDVRDEVGAVFNKANVRDGWQKARRRGARVVPVWISLKP